MMKLEKYSMGVGDRFGRQGKAQLSAMIDAWKQGMEVVPVWNKSHREHSIIGTKPGDVRTEADATVKDLDWENPYHVDADHIGLSNVDLFLDASDFFTLDVADFTGEAASDADIDAFVKRHADLIGKVEIPGIDPALEISEQQVRAIASKYLLAVQEAEKIYRHVEEQKGAGNFITEVSMDETDDPQTPVEMVFILAAIADCGIPAQTIAPKFTGRFNKGVDYVGDVEQFTREFEEDLAVIAFAVDKFDLPENLKLSVHSGSDKFSIYGPIRNALEKTGAGLHLKTAGTTWLEEIIGLAESGGEGLEVARDIYRASLERYDELCGPYATVIDIDVANLPEPDVVDQWDGEHFGRVLRHDQSCDDYNKDFRQLLHVGYKVAAEMGERYLATLDDCEENVARNVKENILERHLKRVFPQAD
ncbi:MAG: tagaturonate epimerase family protein [Candidatus Sumerlaeota bacterium]